MDLKQYLRILRDQWLLVTLCALLGAAAAGAYAFTRTPMYAAQAQLFVSTSGGTDVTQAYQGGMFSQQRVKSYADIVSSPAVVRRVVDRLHLPYTVERLQQEIQASAPLDTVLIDYTVTDSSATRARDIANALGEEFSAFVNGLETPQGGSASPVKVSVTQPAALPDSPVSPRKPLDLALGLLVGLGLGFGAALLRDSLDNTVASRAGTTEVAGAPVLGAIAEDPQAKERPLIVSDDRFSTRAEAFRQLRTNIRFLNVDKDVHALAVTSAVEAEGKTTTTTNLAIALAQAGDRVVLVDADLRRPAVGELMGLPTGVGLTSVLLGDVPLADALQPWHSDLPLRVLTSGPIPPNPSELLSSHRMAEVIVELAAEADVLLFDLPPLLPVTDAAILARLTNGAVLVARAGRTRMDQVDAAAQALRAVDVPVLGVVLSRIPRRGKGSSYARYGYGYGYRPTQPPAESPVVQVPVSRSAA